jgi:hypothetical protein
VKLVRDDGGLATADLAPGLTRDLADDVADELPQPEGDDSKRDVLDPSPVEKREHNFSFSLEWFHYNACFFCESYKKSRLI